MVARFWRKRKDINKDKLSAEEYLILKKSLDEITPSEQEPVAWMDEYGDVLSASVVDGSGLRNIPLYTAPPQREWVGLTDDEVWDAYEKGMYEEMWFARAIEAKLREKNGGT